MEIPEESKPGNTGSTPEWLEKLQNDSWQAEVLISGGAFVGLITIFGSLNGFVTSLVYSSRINGILVGFLGVLIIFCCIFLATGFLIHLILRGYWIGLIGLNYVFPGGIDKEKLSFKGSFTKLIGNASNIPLILRMDKVCGGIFAITFISFLSIVGLTIYGGLMAVIITTVGQLGSKPLLGITIIVLVLVGLTSFVDYLTFGWIKRIKWFSRVYYPVHYLVSWITLSIIYRRLYYTLTSNVKWRYLFLFLILLQILIATATIKMPDGASGLMKSFMPKNSGIQTEGYPDLLSIKEEVITGQTLEVSVIHPIRLEESMFEIWQRNNKRDSTRRDFAELGIKDQLKLIDSTYRIYIDGELVHDLKWSPRVVTSQDNLFAPSRNILKTRINVSRLTNGEHELTIKIYSTDEWDLFALADFSKLGFNAKIYFYIERPVEGPHEQVTDR